MKHLSVFFLSAFVGLAFTSGLAAADHHGCKRKKFETEVVKEACKGGQKAAKKAMQKFVKAAKTAKKAAGDKNFSLTCNDCHSSIKKDSGYPLKPDGLKKFKDLLEVIKKHDTAK